MTATSERQVSRDELSFAAPCVASFGSADLEAIVLFFKDLAGPVVILHDLAQRL